MTDEELVKHAHHEATLRENRGDRESGVNLHQAARDLQEQVDNERDSSPARKAVEKML